METLTFSKEGKRSIAKADSNRKHLSTVFRSEIQQVCIFIIWKCISDVPCVVGRNRYSTGSARTSIGCQGQGFCPSSSPELASGFIWARIALKRKRVDVGSFFEKPYYQYRPGVCASHPAWPSTTRHCHLLSWISLSHMRHSQFLASIVSSIVKNMQLMPKISYKMVLNCCCCSLYLIVLSFYVLLSLGVLVTLSPIDSKSSTHINIINSAFLKRAICPGIGQVHTTRKTLRIFAPCNRTFNQHSMRWHHSSSHWRLKKTDPIRGANSNQIHQRKLQQLIMLSDYRWLGPLSLFWLFRPTNLHIEWIEKLLRLLLANYSFWKWCS